jgi:hypothetical protein
MRSRRSAQALVLAAALPAALIAGAPARTAPVSGSWGTAQQIPGLAALNVGGAAQVWSLSCPSTGNCSAAGLYVGRAQRVGIFVASQHNGRWGRAEQLPGTAALNVGNYASLNYVSCARPGHCSAAGNYGGRGGSLGAYVDSEHNGRWERAERVPGITARGSGVTELNSLSCGSVGNCSAGGSYAERSGRTEAFVVTQRNGRWGHAEEVPGTAALNTGGLAEINSVSCRSAGNCTAGGDYSTPGNVNVMPTRAFVVSQQNGRWGRAELLPGLTALDTGRQSQVTSVSCSSPGNCAAAGYYTTRSYNSLAFVVSERHGRWGKALEVPGIAALSKAGFAVIDSVSCATASSCAAGGHYAVDVGGLITDRAFAVAEQNGTWGRAEQVPGLAALGNGKGSVLWSVSCAGAGHCSGGGQYTFGQHGSIRFRAYVVSQSRGAWGEAGQVPGLRGESADVRSVSCAPAGRCTAGGYYVRSGRSQAFVVSQTG